MVPDKRIIEYREAVIAMKQGRFMVEVQADAEDDVGRLGMALLDLGETLESRFRGMSALTTVTEKINAGFILDDVLEHVYQSFRSILPYDRIGFSLLEEDPTEGALVRARWTKSDSDKILLTVGFTTPLSGSSLETIIETGRPRIINDLEAYSRDHPDSQSTQLIVSEGIRSSLTCPLVADGKPVGFMFFSSRYTDTYQDIHVEVFQEIAGQLSTIVEKGRMYQELVELNEIKSRFLGMAAHDLRNPLGAIRGWADLLESGLAGPATDKQRDMLGKITAACERMLGLINSLLDVSVIDAGRLDLERRPVDLAAYLAESCETFGILARSKDIHLETEVAESLPTLSLDLDRMDQVLGNLIGNAIKFSPRAAKVILKAEQVGKMVKVSVTDQGPGIPTDEIDAIFGGFDKGSAKATEGERLTGLGLMIAKRMVEAHGGRLTVTSNLGEGATFILSLPMEPKDMT